ncbi:hypothetical protein HYV86_01885 [Candidatus Woesearchaeota archaeon]|nr:hypothetical protein [Candidatus Woesearchaeota archaeon]
MGVYYLASLVSSMPRGLVEARTLYETPPQFKTDDVDKQILSLPANPQGYETFIKELMPNHHLQTRQANHYTLTSNSQTVRASQRNLTSSPLILVTYNVCSQSNQMWRDYKYLFHNPQGYSNERTTRNLERVFQDEGGFLPSLFRTMQQEGTLCDLIIVRFYNGVYPLEELEEQLIEHPKPNRNELPRDPRAVTKSL